MFKIRKSTVKFKNRIHYARETLLPCCLGVLSAILMFIIVLLPSGATTDGKLIVPEQYLSIIDLYKKVFSICVLVYCLSIFCIFILSLFCVKRNSGSKISNIKNCLTKFRFNFEISLNTFDFMPLVIMTPVSYAAFEICHESTVEYSLWLLSVQIHLMCLLALIIRYTIGIVIDFISNYF